MILVLSKDEMSIEKEQDVVPFLGRVKEHSIKAGLSVINQTKLLTAASELVRNMLKYAGGGTTLTEIVCKGRENGVRITFADTGPGISDINKAMEDGFSTGKSLGLGLPGARRLSSEFSIQSTVGQGTTVKIIKWKNG
jgi:serine/threonine-protein kinase RsbT